jgi:hypothetical protein
MPKVNEMVGDFQGLETETMSFSKPWEKRPQLFQGLELMAK